MQLNPISAFSVTIIDENYNKYEELALLYGFYLNMNWENDTDFDNDIEPQLSFNVDQVEEHNLANVIVNMLDFIVTILEDAIGRNIIDLDVLAVVKPPQGEYWIPEKFRND